MDINRGKWHESGAWSCCVMKYVLWIHKEIEKVEHDYIT